MIGPSPLAAMANAHKARRERFQQAATRPREIAMPVAKPVIWIAPPQIERKYPIVESIGRASAKYYGVTWTDIKSARRTNDVVRPRQVAMYLAKKITLKSLPEIGRHFGNRDHTTVLHAVRKIGRLILVDAGLAYDVAHIELALGVAQ